MTTSSADGEFDVLLVGFGPVGQSLAALLGAGGHHVGVVERHSEPFPLPRAIHFDHEIMRVWQRLGIVDDIAASLFPVPRYDWFGADGELILSLDHSSVRTRSCWSPSYHFMQPEVERGIQRAVSRRPSVEILRDWEAFSLDEESSGSVTVGIRGSAGARTLQAKYVVGADGANSITRQLSGIESDDLGFRERWLMVDFHPRERSAIPGADVPRQYSDPARPHAVMPLGREDVRFEFMRLPEEADHEPDDAAVWELIAPWVGPEDGELIRHRVYEFRSMLARTMRSGRVMLVGDAAHLMPPFMGQGMCAGIRDAVNLAWRLDGILRGKMDESTLESFSAERQEQNRAIVEISQRMGEVSCVLDPAEAAERDRAFRAGEAPPPEPMPGLVAGVLHLAGGCGLDRVAGELSVQGLVRFEGREGRFDDLVGRGWVLISADGDPKAALRPQQYWILDSLGVVAVALGVRPGEVTDVDGRLTDWLGDRGLAAVVVRPDFYAFGGVADLVDLPELVDDLAGQLGLHRDESAVRAVA